MKIKNSKYLYIVAVTALLTLGACNNGASARTGSEANNGDSATAITWLTDVAEAKTIAAERNAIIMVDVYTDWCHWCKKLDENAFSDISVVNLSKSMVNLKVNAEDNGQGTALAQQFGVQGYPTILFITADGKEVDRIGGYLEAPEFAGEVERIQSGNNTLLSIQKAIDSGSLTPDQRLETAVKLMQRGSKDNLDKLLDGLKPADIQDDQLRENSYLILTDYTVSTKQYEEAENYLLSFISNYPESENIARVHMFLVIVNVYDEDSAGAKKYLDSLKSKFPAEKELINQAESYLSQLSQ